MIKVKVNTRDRDENDNLRILELTYFDEIDISLKFDSVMSTFRFKIYFNSDNQEIAEILAPSHMHEVLIYYVHDKPGNYLDVKEINRKGKPTYQRVVNVNSTDELIITGFAVNTVFKASAKPEWVEISGYSKCGILERADIPTSLIMSNGLESNGLSFRQIANKMLGYFKNKYRGGFDFLIKSTRADSPFDTPAAAVSGRAFFRQVLAMTEDEADKEIVKSTALEAGSVLSYLQKLAIQKGIVLGHDRFGNLVADVAYTGDDYLFEAGCGNKPIQYIELMTGYNGSEMYSNIEVVRQPDKNGGNLSVAKVVSNIGTTGDLPSAFAVKEASLRNPLCVIVYIPKVITQTSGDDTSAVILAERELANQYKNIPLSIKLHKPVINGKFIFPNNTIRVQNRGVYLYEPSKWFIQDVNYVKSSNEEHCTCICVLPGTYNLKPLQQKDPFLPDGRNHPTV
jgi:hypothetical protein